MKSIEERLNEVRDDPVKLKRVFTITWVSAYSMLVLGGLIIVWVLVQNYLGQA